jgi:hypothetical protein
MMSAADDKRDDISLQAVMSEISALEAAMRELLQSADKAIGAAGALIVTGVGFALTNRTSEWSPAPVVLIVLPYGITAAFFFMIQKYIERQIRAGIKRWLEEAVNFRLGQPVFQQTRVFGQLKRPDELAAAAMYTLGAIVIITSSFTSIATYAPPKSLSWLQYVWWLHIVGLLACFVVVGSAWRRMKSAEDEAYKKARESRIEQTLREIPGAT